MKPELQEIHTIYHRHCQDICSGLDANKHLGNQITDVSQSNKYRSVGWPVLPYCHIIGGCHFDNFTD